MIQPLVPKTEFPIFEANPNLIYLDSAATSQKPRVVIEAEAAFYRTSNANVHRGIYALAERATEQFEAARATVATFIGADPIELVFTKGATEAINLVAQSFVRPRLTKKHQIIVTIAEHHANFVPWQQLAKEMGAKFTVVAVDREGQIDLNQLEAALKERPSAIVAIADVGNVLGTVNPTAKIIELAHRYGTPVLVDAAQSLAHLPVNAQRLDADFLVGSAHKLYGPTGIGFLWAKREHLEAMTPSQFGGEMIRSVSVKETTWNDVPWKFEAGTPNIAGAIGFAAALNFISSLGWEPLASHEEALLSYADDRLRAIDGIRIFGPMNPLDRAGLISFIMDGLHSHDLVSILDEQSVELRAGHHCAQPLHEFLGVPVSARASFGVYSSSKDIDRLAEGIQLARRVLTSNRPLTTLPGPNLMHNRANRLVIDQGVAGAYAGVERRSVQPIERRCSHQDGL